MQVVERRKAVRHTMSNYFVEYMRDQFFWFLSFLSRAKLVRASLVNISRGGINLLTQERLPVWESYRFRIEPKTLADPLTLRGRVVWCQQVEGKEHYRIGVHFDRIGSSAQSALDQLIEENQVYGRMERWSLNRS